MREPIIRKELFPFVCQNPDCGEKYDVEEFRDVLNLWGLVYADCDDWIYQGITCPKCRKTSLIDLPNDKPLVDLSHFIITPNPDFRANVIEQVNADKRRHRENPLFRFNYFPAWDHHAVSRGDMESAFVLGGFCFPTPDIPHETKVEVYELLEARSKGSGVSCLPDLRASEVPRESDQEILDSHEALSQKLNDSDSTDHLWHDVPYIMHYQEVQHRLDSENETGSVRLRRLYPDVPKFRNLLTCLAPNRITSVDISDAGLSMVNDLNSPQEIQERKNAWTGLLEAAAGKPLKGIVKNRLQPHGVSDFDDKTVNDVVNQHAFWLDRRYADPLRQRSDKVGFEATIWGWLREEVLPNILYPVCTEIALRDKRAELSEWVNKIEPGKALFVDTPMGLGKTYSIVEALVENPALSAVIFMPTNRLCEEIVRKLKTKIATKKGLKYWEHFENEQDFLGHKLKREFLEDEVYFAEGINQENCRHFDKIVKRYRQNWITKQGVCKKCEKEPECRFISHWKRAPLSRIVVTTHAQYDHFCQQSRIRKWFKYGYARKDEAVQRDIFIVDEDLVLSRCYQPMAIDRKEIGAFTATLIGFLKNLEDKQIVQIAETRQTIQTLLPTHPSEDVIDDLRKREKQQVRDLRAIRDVPLAEIETKIHRLFSQSNMPGKTSVVPRVDQDFRFPVIVKKKWSETFPGLTGIIPEYLDRPEIVGNYLEALESGLRLGVVVQKFTGRDRVYLPNPKFYDLSGLPPHVFFDGTMLDWKFLEKKLRNVRFEPVKISVKPLWRLRVWQNVNTDLPKKGTRKDKPDRQRVEQFVRDLIGELGKDHKYLFLTTKATSEAYLEGYLDELRKEEPDFNYVLEYFGKLKGLNEAKDCDIGVMLGSYNPSDAVEIAMALEFIQDKLPDKITATQNNLWKWRQTNTVRRYEPDYADVQHLADKLRQNEHRQGIARTRYLFHDVDFYIVSKDRLTDYEPFLSNIETDQYRADIFPPRPQRPTNDGKVKEAVLGWFDNHKTLTEMELHRETRMSRTTLRKHLRRMLTEGLLDREKKRYILHSNL